MSQTTNYNLYWTFRPVLLQCKLFWFRVKCTKRYVFSTVNYLINTWKYQYLVYVVAELLQPIWPFYPHKLLAVLVRIWKYFWYQQKINGKSIFKKWALVIWPRKRMSILFNRLKMFIITNNARLKIHFCAPVV